MPQLQTGNSICLVMSFDASEFDPARSVLSFICNGFVDCDHEDVAYVTRHCQLSGGITRL
jgi:hypothetical protein